MLLTEIFEFLAKLLPQFFIDLVFRARQRSYVKDFAFFATWLIVFSIAVTATVLGGAGAALL